MGLSVFSTKEFGESCEESETGGGIQNPEVQEPEAIQGQGNQDPRGGCYGYCQSAFMEKSVC